MGTLVIGERKLIFQEGARFRSAVSEELIQRLAAIANFISLYQHSEKQFFLNGSYHLMPLPLLAADGMAFMEFNAEIIDVYMFISKAGSAGITELDIKTAPTPGGTFTSIFTTTPKIAYDAGDYYWVHVGATGLAGTGTVAPVLSTANIDAGAAIRCDLIQAQSGVTTQSCGLIAHYRPR